MSAPLLIPDEQVRRGLSMRACIDGVERAYAYAGAREVAAGIRQVVHSEGGARLLALTAASRQMGALVSLAYSGRPVGFNRRASAFSGVEKVITVFDPESGACRAVLGGNYLTWLYTGAMGAVAVKHLADPDVRTLALLGSGRQARSALAGIREVRPVEHVRVWSPTPGRAQQFADVHRAPGLDVVAAASATHAVHGAEIVVTVTTAATPIVKESDLAPGRHVNAIGAHYRDRRELGGDVVAASTVFVDTVEQARQEKGELLLAVDEGAFSYSDVEAELGTVVALGGRSRQPGERTLFCSSASGIELLGATVAALQAVDADDTSMIRFN